MRHRRDAGCDISHSRRPPRSAGLRPPPRAAILLAKAESKGMALPDDVAFLIARRMRSNVRDLEGALNTLSARATFTGRGITTDFAQEALRDLLTVQERAVSMPNILKTVADYYQLRQSDLLARLGGQVFLTTTHPEFILLDEHRRDFQVAGGVVTG